MPCKCGAKSNKSIPTGARCHVSVVQIVLSLLLQEPDAM